MMPRRCSGEHSATNTGATVVTIPVPSPAAGGTSTPRKAPRWSGETTLDDAPAYLREPGAPRSDSAWKLPQRDDAARDARLEAEEHGAGVDDHGREEGGFVLLGCLRG